MSSVKRTGLDGYPGAMRNALCTLAALPLLAACPDTSKTDTAADAMATDTSRHDAAARDRMSLDAETRDRAARDSTMRDGDQRDAPRPDHAIHDVGRDVAPPDASSDRTTADAGPALPPDCDRLDIRGQFVVTSDATRGTVRGGLKDNPEPNGLDELRREGDCAVFSLAAPRRCDPPCQAPLVCGFGDVCRPVPSYISVGTIHISGTTPELTIEPSSFAAIYYAETGPDLYQPGDPIALAASGSAEVDAFAVATSGVAPLALTTTQYSMARSTPLTIVWTAAARPADSVVLLKLCSEHHASQVACVECQVADAAGSLTVPANIVDDYYFYGSSGLFVVGDANLTRLTRSVVETGRGCVRLSSESTQAIQIDAAP